MTEDPLAIEVRDALHEAVARVVAGGGPETVRLRMVNGYTVPEAAPCIARGVYLATWGRRVSAQVLSGPGGAAVVIS